MKATPFTGGNKREIRFVRDIKNSLTPAEDVSFLFCRTTRLIALRGADKLPRPVASCYPSDNLCTSLITGLLILSITSGLKEAIAVWSFNWTMSNPQKSFKSNVLFQIIR